jgi:N-acetyl-1-D-myo-inositol-2-amino-2-deoxy-alpha-D-glucopyranoside deacetylase
MSDTNGSTSFAGRSLLAIFAHPDDESIACGGLLALCADRGVHVTLLCATHGENNCGTRDEVWFEQRAGELHEAAAILGVRDVILLDYRDGFLPWAGDLSDRLEEEIRRIRPDAVVTFGKDGLYWHPDHIAVCEATTAAVDALGHDGPALYYVTMPPGQMRRIIDELWSAEESVAKSSPLFGVADPDAFGVGAAAPSIVVDVSACAGRKLAALKCHRSQIHDGALARISDGDAARFLGVEHLHRPPGSRVRSRRAFLECV